MSEPDPVAEPSEGPTSPTDATARFGSSRGGETALLDAGPRPSPIGLVPLDVATRRFVDATEGLCRRCGYRADALLAMGPGHISHPEDRLDFLVRLGAALRGLDDPADMAHEASRLLGRFLQVARVGYAEDEGDGQHFSVQRNHVFGVPGIEGRHRYSAYGPDMLAALRTGHTVVCPDIAAAPSLTDADRAAHARLQIGASVSVPVLQGQRLLAVFFVHCARPRAWTALELGLMEEVAARLRADLLRARAEARNRTAQLRLEAALRGMSDAVLIADEHGHFVDCNEAFLALHRLPGKAALPRSLAEYARCYELTDAAGQPLPLASWPLPSALRGETSLGRDIGVRRIDDEPGGPWMGRHSWAPIQDRGGVAGAVLRIHDDTELRRVGAELDASQAQLRRLLAALGEAQEKERLRIARELHDELQQSLAAIAIEVGAARRELPIGGRGALALDRIEQSARASIAATRRTIHDLRLAVLDDLGLVAALAWQAREFAALTGIECRFERASLTAADEARLTPALAANLYRIAQEALNNVRRHSGAVHVAVWLGSEAQARVRLRIADDGRGIASADAAIPRQPERFGLLGMRERVRAAGGSLDITTTPGGGATIDVIVPLPPSPDPPPA